MKRKSLLYLSVLGIFSLSCLPSLAQKPPQAVEEVTEESQPSALPTPPNKPPVSEDKPKPPEDKPKPPEDKPKPAEDKPKPAENKPIEGEETAPEETTEAAPETPPETAPEETTEAAPETSPEEVTEETRLNTELQAAVCAQNWKGAIEIINLMLKEAPESQYELESYRSELERLDRVNARVPNWPGGCGGTSVASEGQTLPPEGEENNNNYPLSIPIIKEPNETATRILPNFPSPPVSNRPNPGFSDNLSLLMGEYYQRINIGMTYREVSTLLGQTGEPVSQSRAYTWEKEDGSTFIGEFENGSLTGIIKEAGMNCTQGRNNINCQNLTMPPEFDEIKRGMSYKQVKEKLGQPQTTTEINQYEWSVKKESNMCQLKVDFEDNKSVNKSLQCS